MKDPMDRVHTALTVSAGYSDEPPSLFCRSISRAIADLFIFRIHHTGRTVPF